MCISQRWWDKTEHFAAEQTKKGDWEVTLKVTAQKLVVDAAGIEKTMPRHDWLEIVIYEMEKEKPL